MLLLVPVICALLSLGEVAATSSGYQTTCNALADWGCSKWDESKAPNQRKYCVDEAPGIMPWVTKPIWSNHYSVRTGDGDLTADATTYTPGKLTNIYIRTLAYDSKWRGVIIQAMDSKGAIVGEWDIPGDTNSLIHTPCGNKGVALHVSAEVKPLLVRVHWRAPANGTGNVTFHSLIKEGPANTGEFYWTGRKGVPLSLDEGEPTRQTWWAAEAGESCQTVCEAEGLPCQQSRLHTMDSVEKFEAHIGTEVACNLPLLNGCSSGDPMIDTKNSFCYFHHNQCKKLTGRPSPPLLCSTPVEDSHRRFCPCGFVVDNTKLSGAPTATGALHPLAVVGALLLLLGLY